MRDGRKNKTAVCISFQRASERRVELHRSTIRYLRGCEGKKNVSDVIERAELENAWTEDKETFQKG